MLDLELKIPKLVFNLCNNLALSWSLINFTGSTINVVLRDEDLQVEARSSNVSIKYQNPLNSKILMTEDVGDWLEISFLIQTPASPSYNVITQ